MSFEWFFQGYDRESPPSSASVLVGLNFDDHDSQTSMNFGADAERLSQFLSAVHDIVNYDGKEYTKRVAVLRFYGTASLTVTGLLCEGEHGFTVEDFSFKLVSSCNVIWTFYVYGTKDVLRFCHDGWKEVNRVMDDGE